MIFARSRGPQTYRDGAGVMTLDADDCIVSINPVLERWLGCASAELAGRPANEVLREPTPDESMVGEELPDLYFLSSQHDGPIPVLAAFAPDADGGCEVTLVSAEAQLDYARAIHGRHSLAERNQRRLELVISSAVAFADAASETDIVQTICETATQAYAAEESAVFLIDAEGGFQLAAGTNALAELQGTPEFNQQASELRTALKVSGVEAAYAIAETLGQAFESSGVQSLIVAPIRLPEESIGFLAVFFHHPREFDEQASPLADALTGQAARAISGLRLQQRLEHAALHDDTTGLPNRRVFETTLEGLSAPRESLVAVLFVDLDGFKQVNDQLGHQVGDDILRAVAGRLQATVREDDIVARYGGDEFVIVCQVPDERSALDLAERVRAAVCARYSMLPENLDIGASVGVSITAIEFAPTQLDRLVREADQAMYRAKNAGGNQVADAFTDGFLLPN